MASGKIHPHIDMPSEDDLARVVAERHPGHRDLYVAVHRLVIDAVPDARYSVDCVDGAIGYGARQFGYDGWGMVAVTPFKNWVSVAFLRGARLDDPSGLLEGQSALIRQVKLRDADDLEAKRDALRLLMKAASQAQ